MASSNGVWGLTGGGNLYVGSFTARPGSTAHSQLAAAAGIHESEFTAGGGYNFGGSARTLVPKPVGQTPALSFRSGTLNEPQQTWLADTDPRVDMSKKDTVATKFFLGDYRSVN